MDRVDALTGLAMAVGLLLVVLVENALRAAGLSTLASIVYPLGYGTIVVSAWYVWIRPLDIRAPDAETEVWQSESPGEEREADTE